jgi:acyl carrier protein
MALEEEFGIEILDEDAEKIKTIEDIVRYLTDREKNDKTPSGG